MVTLAAVLPGSEPEGRISKHSPDQHQQGCEIISPLFTCFLQVRWELRDVSQSH
jgi:hypothetical protein